VQIRRPNRTAAFINGGKLGQCLAWPQLFRHLPAPKSVATEPGGCQHAGNDDRNE
jgi:hypothetical protein